MSVADFSDLSTEEKQALSQARAYRPSLPTLQSQLKQLTPPPRPSSPDTPSRPGVHIIASHRQNLRHYSTAGLWSNEEALFSRAALLRWRRHLHLSNLVDHTRVADGLTRLITTAAPPADAGRLLPRILSGRAGARITAAELQRVESEAIGVFALSYRHEGPKGQSISARLWTDVVSVASAVAASAGFREYSLWIDCVSAASAKDVIDWFTVGVAPYLLLPTLLVAPACDYRRRMWLRMEEKLSQYGSFCVTAVRSPDAVVRLEPNSAEIRTPYERIWCLCQSVVRGEFNGLVTSLRKDYLNLLEWATKFDKSPLNFRGLQNVFGEHDPRAFRDALPIETNSYVVLPLLPRMPWLHGAEAFAGRVEYAAEMNNTFALWQLRDDAHRVNRDEPMYLLSLRNSRKLALYHSITPGAAAHIQRCRWRSYAMSTLLVVELTPGGWWNTASTVRKMVLVGTMIHNLKHWNFKSAHGLELIPEPVQGIVGARGTTVSSVQIMPMQQFDSLLSNEEDVD